MLYKRDYTELTPQESKSWQDAKDALEMARTKDGGIGTPIEALNKYWNDTPIAAEYYQQLFPNNYLRFHEPEDNHLLIEVRDKFKLLLDSSATEREVLNFIKDNEAYFLVASMLKKYDFGHHGAFAFREFALPPNYVVDFLLVGKNSGGYEFIFVELESPYGNIVTKSGDFGITIRKGLAQIADWDSWIEANYSHLRLMYSKYLGKIEPLPSEFFELDKSRIHYVVVAGRRSDFSKKTRLLKRRLLKQESVSLLHYDNLLDNVDLLLSYGGY